MQHRRPRQCRAELRNVGQHLAGMPVPVLRDILPLHAMGIEKNAWAWLPPEFINLAAHITQINVRTTGIGHVDAGLAAGVDQDVGAAVETAGHRGPVAPAALEQHDMRRKNQVVLRVAAEIFQHADAHVEPGGFARLEMGVVEHGRTVIGEQPPWLRIERLHDIEFRVTDDAAALSGHKPGPRDPFLRLVARDQHQIECPQPFVIPLLTVTGTVEDTDQAQRFQAHPGFQLHAVHFGNHQRIQLREQGGNDAFKFRVGAEYGGSIPAILIRTPGEAASVMTSIDGYEMAKNGRAGAALAVSAIGSFIAGTIGVIGLTLFAVPLTSIALKFGPAEYFTLMLFAMTAVSTLTGASPAKGVLSTVLGLMIATIGIDLQSGQARFTMGIPEFQDGVGFVVVVVGLFAMAEVFRGLEDICKGTSAAAMKITGQLWLTREEWRRSMGPIWRGCIIGFVIGVLPGVGPKSAQRMAFHLLERNREGGRALARALEEAATGVVHCRRCRMLTDGDLCEICSAPRRDATVLCIVESPADVVAVEQSGGYAGRYFVLMGHLSPLDGVGPDQLGFDRLEAQLDEGEIREVILATNPTVEGEATAHYIGELVARRGIRASRIAHGVPVGGELEYVDGGTLAHALAGRQVIA